MTSYANVQQTVCKIKPGSFMTFATLLWNDIKDTYIFQSAIYRKIWVFAMLLYQQNGEQGNWLLFIFLLLLRFLGHLSHSGDLLLWVGVRRRPSSVVRLHLFLKNYANLNHERRNWPCWFSKCRNMKLFFFLLHK